MRPLAAALILSIFCVAPFAFAEPCRVGLLLPLTGPLAEYGVATQNALALANEDAPVQTEFAAEDNQFDAAVALSAYRSLVSRGRYDLIYNWGEITSSSVAPVAEKEKRALLTMSVDPRPAKGKRFVLRTLNPSTEFVATGLEFLRSRGLQRVVVFLAQDPFFEDQFAELKRLAGEKLVKSLEFPPDATDFRSGITALKDLPFDGVFVYLAPGAVSTFAKQFRALGFKQQLIGTDILESQTEIDQAEGSLEGAVYVSPAVTSEFRKRYTERFGNDLQIAYAFNAYKMGKVIAAACEAGQPAEVLLEKLQKSASAAPDLEFVGETDSAGFFRTPLRLRRIEKGRIVE